MNITTGALLLHAAGTSSLEMAAASTSTASAKPSPIVLSVETGRPWVEKCIELHPEILWLAISNVRATQEGQAAQQGAYSEQLFGHRYNEFDRTLMTLQCLKWILDGSETAYQEFTQGQKTARLARESFQNLHAQCTGLVKSQWQGLTEEQMIEAMETALVLGDIGKSEKARQLFLPYGVKAPDHDDFYGEAMAILAREPALCPSFARLPESSQKLLSEIANLAHYGHITHLEGGPGMFSKIKQSGIAQKDPIALSFDLFVHTCDVAGAGGHINRQFSIVYNEQTHKAMQAMSAAVRLLSNPNTTERDACQAYVEMRASWLGLDPKDPANRILARVGAMLRLFTPEEGSVLRKAMQELSQGDRARIIAQLDAQNEDLAKRTPTYMPAVLVNLSNNHTLGASKEERIASAVVMGLPFIARVLERHAQLIDQKLADPNIPLNFNVIAGVVKTSPESLKQEFIIDKEGNVLIQGL